MLSSGRKTWTALIEAKIGSAEVAEEQLKQYLLQAKKHKGDAVITIPISFPDVVAIDGP